MDKKLKNIIEELNTHISMYERLGYTELNTKEQHKELVGWRNFLQNSMIESREKVTLYNKSGVIYSHGYHDEALL